MRHRSKSTLSNPIDATSAQNLVEYVLKNGGFLRVEFTRSTGEKRVVLLRPVRLLRVDANTYLIGRDFRDLRTQSEGGDSAAEKRIDLQLIDTLAYRAEKDTDNIITGEGGTFRFLRWDFPVNLSIGGIDYPSAARAFQAGIQLAEAALKKGEKLPKDAVEQRMQEVLVKKFTSPLIQRFLVATGSRAFALPPWFGIDYNDLLTQLRSDAIAAKVPHSKPLPAKYEYDQDTFESTETESAQGFMSTAMARGDLSAANAQLLAYAAEQENVEGVEVIPVDPVLLRRGEEKPYDVLIYVESPGDRGRGLAALEALVDVKPLVVQEPPNITDSATLDGILEKVLAHPEWTRYGLASPAFTPGSAQSRGLTVNFLNVLTAALQDPERRRRVRRAVKVRYTADGDLLAPFEGKVAAVEKTATTYRIKLASPATLPGADSRQVQNNARMAERAADQLMSTLGEIAGELQHEWVDTELAHERVRVELANYRLHAERKDKRLSGISTRDEIATLSKNRATLLEQIELAQKQTWNKMSAAEKVKERILRAQALGPTSVEANFDIVQVKQKEAADIQWAISSLSEIDGTLVKYTNFLKALEEAALKNSNESPQSANLAERIDALLRRKNVGIIAERAILKARIDKLTKALAQIPQAFRSSSRTEILKALSKLYPGPGTTTEYGEAYGTLYRYDTIDVPVSTPPSVKVGDVLSRDSVIPLGGMRKDVVLSAPVTYTVDSAVVFYQDHPITCAPVNIEVMHFDPPVKGHAAISELVNGTIQLKSGRSLPLQELILRTRAVNGMVLTLGDITGQAADAELARLSKVFQESGKKDWITDCAQIDPPEFTEQPVFYVVLVDSARKRAWVPPLTTLVPEIQLYRDGSPLPPNLESFLDSVKEKHGPELGPALAELLLHQKDTEPFPGLFMSDLPVPRLPVLKELSQWEAGMISYLVKPGPVLDAVRANVGWEPNRQKPSKSISGARRTARTALAAVSDVARHRQYGSGTATFGVQGVTRIKSGVAAPGAFATLGGAPQKQVAIPSSSPNKPSLAYADTRAGPKAGPESVQLGYVQGDKDRFHRYIDTIGFWQKKVAPTEQQQRRSAWGAERRKEEQAAELKAAQSSSGEDEAPILDFRGKYSFLSNFAEVEGGVTLPGDPNRYKSVLSAYIAAQVDPKNTAIRAKIQRMTPYDALKYSRSDKSDMPAPPPGWESLEEGVLRPLLEQKFDPITQAETADKLLSTGQAELVDPYGGTLNMLGLLLMEIRAKLRQERGWQTKENPRYRAAVRVKRMSRRNPDDDDDYADVPAVAASQVAADRAAAAAAAEYRTQQEKEQLRQAEADRPRQEEQKAQQAQDTLTANIQRLRNGAQAAWKDFTESLRGRGANKKSGEELQKLLDSYTVARKKLEKLLDERDIEILKKPEGSAALKELLTREAFQFAAGTRAVYAQRPRNSKDYFGTQLRSAVALDISEMVDAFGRPLAPPSKMELLSAGLSGDLDLAPATLPTTASEEQQSTSMARSLPAAITYTQLRQAADIAAKAERSSAKGTSASAVYCKVAGQDKRVAIRLANAVPFLQFLFGKLRGEEGINKTDTITLWISPPGLPTYHAIFYANGYPTCEFHDASFVALLATILKYTEDWVNDLRHTNRQRYRVMVGQSGVMFPHSDGSEQGALFQVWGQQPAKSPPKNYQNDIGPFVAQTAFERLLSWGLLSPTGGLSPSASGVPTGATRYWTSDKKAKEYQVDSSEVFVDAEAKAYRDALVAAGYSSVGPREIQILKEGAAEILGKLSKERVSEVASAIKTGLTTKVATLFYPRLYGIQGDKFVLTSDNEDTPRQLKVQLDALVSSVENGTTLRVIDGGMFRGQALLLALSRHQQFDPQRAFGKDETGTAVVTPPAFYLRQQLTAANKKNIHIEVVCPVSTQVKESGVFELFDVQQETTDPPVRMSFIPARMLSDSLKSDYASGSTLVIWNDPDTENTTLRFGSRHGMEDMAAFLAQTLGMYKRVVVESEFKRTLTDLRVEVERGIVERIFRGFAKKRPLSEILGFPEELLDKMPITDDPRVLGPAAFVAVAGAYGRASADFFVMGGRAETGGTVQWARENRGIVRGSRKQLPSLSRRR